MAGFTDTGDEDGKLHVFDYRRGRHCRAKPEKVARERDFYKINVPGEEQNAIEKDFSRLEGDLAPVLRRVIETGALRSNEELGTLLSLAAIIHVRGRRGLDRVYLGLEEMMRAGLADGTLSAEDWEEVIAAEVRAGTDPATLLTYREARRKVKNGIWSPPAPRDHVLGLLHDAQRAMVTLLIPHVWSLAVAQPGTGEFICSDSPLSWSTKETWEPGFVQDESLDAPNVTIIFPLSKGLALITRPYDRRSDRPYSYRATEKVVAWVNTRTHVHSLGTLYSVSEDFGLLKKGNKIRRSTDYFSHIALMRRGAARK